MADMLRRLLPAALLACQPVAVDLEGRPCTDGNCARGYACHPETDTCAPAVTIDCDDPDALCAWTTRAGEPCARAGAFLPCVDGRSDCRAGCRTCREDQTWSECSDPECALGELWSCDRCDHDCRELIANAEPTCATHVAPSSCDYAGDCLGAWVDADGRRENGCECLPAATEICNGEDDDCDGAADEGQPCAGAAVCEDGACVPCTASDPEHCGPTCAVCGPASVCESGGCVPCTAGDPLHCGETCQVCGGDTPHCDGNACVCKEGTCNPGHYCDAGNCRPCTVDGHCGGECVACAGETATCIDGLCQCTAGSCNAGRYCDAGTCAACTVREHCGASCESCSAATPACIDGACRCTPGTCPAGSYCDTGACVPCSCPGLFPTCVDQGGGYVCRCSASSCGAGAGCVDDSTACVWTDNFDGTTSLLQVCAGGVYSSWAVGEPGAGTCRSLPSCWATNLDGPYNNCELSCVASPVLDLAGVAGRIEISFWAYYQLEHQFDGVTTLFRADGEWRLVEPVGGWDTDEVNLGDNCAWLDVTWPALGQYATSDPIGWVEVETTIESATAPEFFHGDFQWRIYLETDASVPAPGIWVDDVEVRVSQSP